MCLHTAAQGAAPDAAARFYRCRGEVDALAAAGALPFSTGAWRAYCAAHPAPQPVRHSGAYRLRERPAYRLVDARYAPLLPVFVRLAAQPGRPGARTLAIDGRAAAGKSTAAALLAAALGAGVVHMDDFFLPAALRTPQRLSEPGGNVHYERFAPRCCRSSPPAPPFPTAASTAPPWATARRGTCPPARGASLRARTATTRALARTGM